MSITRRRLLKHLSVFTATAAALPPQLFAMSNRKETMLTTVTKTVQIRCATEKAFQFLADPSNMPQWAIHNLKSIRPEGGNVWIIETPRGEGKFIPHFDQAYGILDHEFIDPKEGSWGVPARIVSIGPKTSLYIITLTKPEQMPFDAFTHGMNLMDDELQTLKNILEKS